MKIYKVTRKDDIVNYKPIEENILNFNGVIRCASIHRGYNFEQLFLSKEKANDTYNRMLEEISIGADQKINNHNLTYYIHNIWDNNGNPYKTISYVRINEVEVE